MTESAQAKVNRKRRAQQYMRARLHKWEIGDVPKQRRYPRDHPWNGACQPIPPTDPSRYAKSCNHRLTLEEIGEK